MKKRKFGLTGVILVLVILAALFFALISFITDLLWFSEMGYVKVFLTQLFTQLKIGIPAFVVVCFLSVLYLQALKKGYYKRVDSIDNDPKDKKRLNVLSVVLSIIFSGLVTYVAVSQLWFEILKFTNSSDFNIKDPLFGQDVSFYLFKLEFIKQLNGMMIGLIIAFAILTVIYYLLLISMRKPQIFETESSADEPEDEERFTGNFQGSQQGGFGAFGNFGNLGDMFGKFGQAFGGQNIRRTPKPKKRFDDDNFMQLVNIASKQLIALGVIFFLMVGANFFLKQFDLLYSHTGVLYGAGYTDVNITLWVYRILMVLSVLGAVGFVVGIHRRKFRTILAVPVIMILVGGVGMGAGALIQNFVVSPDEINKESPYLVRNIEYTQLAYDLRNVVRKPFSASEDLTQEDIANNQETISNIRINDYEPAKKFYNNLQNIRLYYTFKDVDVDRYMVNGEYTQTFLAAREIDETQTGSQTWLNQHLKYTHGYGITLSRVDKITVSGQPDMLIKDIPPVSDVPEINVTRPEIYFGEMTNNYVILRTDEEEFDYPVGDENAWVEEYQGNAGIKMNFINKLMFAIRERSLKILVSTNIDNDSRIVINRNIEKRVQTIMPRLEYDKDPYIVTADGRLYWIIDAYTFSSQYPYSEPFSEQTAVNYIRNSVKVVIDAYNGDTNYYLVNDEDPIANTYQKIYPTLFKDFDEMPESLKSHIRYPNFMLDIQAQVYRRYHMNDVKVFYQKEDAWDIANEIYGTKKVVMAPNYYIMKLPGETNAEFVNTIPYTPRGKRNMTALLVARNDGEDYGDLVLYQLPKGKQVDGPEQVEAKIDQDTEISKEFSLWDSSGSTYSRGNLFVIPIEDSLLYVEPVYLEATNSSIPEVKRVIVVYGERIAYEPTLGEALESLFGKPEESGQPPEDGPQTPPETPDSTEGLTDADLIRLANEAFINAELAMRNGDWAAYGQYQEQLKQYLNQLTMVE